MKLQDRLAKAIFDIAEAPILLLELNGSILAFNHACETLTGYSASEVKGQKVWDVFIVEEELDSVERVFQETLHETTTFTNYWRTKDGSNRLIEWSNGPVLGDDGKPTIVLATGIDVTEKNLNEEALSENKAFLRSIIDVSPEAVITINEDGAIISFSKQAQEMFGHKEADVLGKNISMMMPEPDKSKHDGYMKSYLRTGEAKIIGRARKVTALRKHGEEFPALLHVGEFTDGERIFVGFIEDITEKAQLESQLAESQFQLQHAGRMAAMGEVTAAVSHELNQPLTAAASLAGAAALTIRNEETKASTEALGLIEDTVCEIRRASQLIQQMRDFIRRGKANKTICDVNELVTEAMTIGLLGTAQDTLDIELSLSSSTGSANVDRIQIQQVITNLVRNAAEALEGTATGKIVLSTERTKESIFIRVADNGPGIRDDIKQRLFEPFVTSKEDGMGIGLSISKAIIDSHQGEILVEDNDPSGTLFVLRLPASP